MSHFQGIETRQNKIMQFQNINTVESLFTLVNIVSFLSSINVHNKDVLADLKCPDLHPNMLKQGIMKRLSDFALISGVVWGDGRFFYKYTQATTNHCSNVVIIVN